jgi:hypothetical protein
MITFHFYVPSGYQYQCVLISNKEWCWYAWGVGPHSNWEFWQKRLSVWGHLFVLYVHPSNLQIMKFQRPRHHSYLIKRWCIWKITLFYHFYGQFWQYFPFKEHALSWAYGRINIFRYVNLSCSEFYIGTISRGWKWVPENIIVCLKFNTIYCITRSSVTSVEVTPLVDNFFAWIRVPLMSIACLFFSCLISIIISVRFINNHYET